MEDMQRRIDGADAQQEKQDAIKVSLCSVSAVLTCCASHLPHKAHKQYLH